MFHLPSPSHLNLSEILYESPTFPNRHLAALLASKVYFHLGDFDDSVHFALGAGELFYKEAAGEYKETIVGKCIDTYIGKMVERYEGKRYIYCCDVLA